jgi:hypothetical protein
VINSAVSSLIGRPYVSTYPHALPFLGGALMILVRLIQYNQLFFDQTSMFYDFELPHLLQSAIAKLGFSVLLSLSTR